MHAIGQQQHHFDPGAPKIHVVWVSQCPMPMMPEIEQAQVQAQDNRTVLLLGAGIHRAAIIRNAEENAVAQQLAGWGEMQEGSHDGNLLGQTLAWELNALDGQAVTEIVEREMYPQSWESLKNSLPIMNAWFDLPL